MRSPSSTIADIKYGFWLTVRSRAFRARANYAIYEGSNVVSSILRHFAQFMESAVIRASVGEALLREVVALGAVNVRELTVADWSALPSWSQLRPLEQRRILRMVPQ